MEQAAAVGAHVASLVDERRMRRLWIFRLALGWVELVAAVIGIFVLSWDIQWHTAVGRDRTLTAPHLFILGCITLMGLTALIAVLVETRWSRQHSELGPEEITFADIFAGSLGAYLVGFGALDSAVAFPLDQYWHTLVGVDVTIWAPFHIMVLAGFCVSCLGMAIMQSEGARLAARRHAVAAARVGYVGVVVALAILMAAFTTLLLPSLTQGYFAIGNLTFTIYPLLLGVLGVTVLMAAQRALRWRWSATSVIVVYLVIGLVNYLLVPVLITWLLGVEQQQLLPDAQTGSVVAVQWQYGLIIAAPLLDSIIHETRQRGWSVAMTNRLTLPGAAIGTSLAALCSQPFLASVRQLSASSAISSGSRTIIASGGTNLPQSSAILILLVSLLLGVVGAVVGHWLGMVIGESLQREA